LDRQDGGGCQYLLWNGIVQALLLSFNGWLDEIVSASLRAAGLWDQGADPAKLPGADAASAAAAGKKDAPVTDPEHKPEYKEAVYR